MEVRREALSKLGQRAVAVRTIAEISQYLVEGAVLLDDVDDVFDVLAQELHGPSIIRGRLAVVVEVVLGDPPRETLELPWLRHRGADQGGALQLELVLIRGPGRGRSRDVAAQIHEGGDRGRGAGQVVGVGPGDALAVDDVHRSAVGAERDVMRLVGGGDQAADLVGPLAMQRDHGHGIGAGVDRIERPAIGGERDREGGGAGVSGSTVIAIERKVAVAVAVAVPVAVVFFAESGQQAGRGPRIDLGDHPVVVRGDHRDLVGIVLGHEQPGARSVEGHAEGVAVERDAFDQPTRGRGADVDHHDLTVAIGRHVGGPVALHDDREGEGAAYATADAFVGG